MGNDNVKFTIEVGSTDAEKHVKDFGKSLDEVTEGSKGTGQAADSVTSAWSKLAIGAGVVAIGVKALSAAFETVTEFMKGSVSAYLEEEESINRLSVALRMAGDSSGSAMDTMEEFAKSMAQLTLYSDDEARSVMQLGFSMGVPIEKLQEATKGAMGLATAYNIDLQTAMKGEFGMLSRYIPALKSATTDSEKLAIVTKAMAGGFTMAQAATETAGGQIKQMQKEVGELQEELGKEIVVAFLPLLRDGFKWLMDNKDSIVGVFQAIVSILKVLAEVAMAAFKAIDFMRKLMQPDMSKYAFMQEALAKEKALYDAQLAENKKNAEAWAKFSEESQQKLYTSLVNFLGQETDAQKKQKQTLFDIEKAKVADRKKALEEKNKLAEEYAKKEQEHVNKYMQGVRDQMAIDKEMAPTKEQWSEALIGGIEKEAEALEKERLAYEALKLAKEGEKLTDEEERTILEKAAKILGINVSELYRMKAAMEGASEATKTFDFSSKSVVETLSNVTIGWQDAINVGGILLNTLDDLRSMMVELGIVTEEDAGKFDDAFSLMDNELRGASAALSGDFAGALESTLNRYMTIFKVTWALFHQGQDQAIERENSWMKITDEQMERMKELATQYGSTHAATSVMLSDLIETNSITVHNFDRYAGRMHEILSDMDQGKLTNEETVQAIGSAWSALMDKMKDLKLPGASKEMIATIQDLRARGMEVAEISEYVDAELGKGIKALGVYFQEASKSSEQFARGQQYMAAMFAETVRTKGYMAAIEEYGSVFDQLAEIAKEKGFAISATLQEAFDMRALLQGNESIAALYEQINATQQILESLGNTGLLTMETFSAAMTDVNAQYAQLIEHGATEKQALQMTGPELAKLWWYSKQYGYALDESTASLIKQGMESGAINAQMIPAQDKMVSLMETMVTLLGGDIPYAMEKTSDSAKALLDGTMSKTKDLNGMMDETFRERSFDGAGIKDSFGEIANAARSLGSEIDGAFRARSFSASFSSGGEVHAATGWEGIVTKPTRFLVGEGGSPEAVRITPMSGRQYGDGVTNQRLEKLELNFTIQTQGGQDVAQEIVKAIELDKYNIRKKAKDAWKFAVSNQ